MSRPPLPAIVFGVDTPIGLTVARELAGHGVVVHGIGRSRTALGRYSRHLASFHVRPRDPERIAELLERVVGPGESVLLAISEGDIRLLNGLRERLPRVRMLIPRPEPFERVLDKATTLAAARRVGIEVPHSAPLDVVATTRPAEILGRYPVVVKWSHPNAVMPLLARAGLPLVKLHYCADLDAVLRLHERYAAVGAQPLVQSYAPGNGLGQFVFMQDGRARLRFQHRRLHEWPPEGGFATLCESLPQHAHGELMERSVALLRALEWEGPAMVEYRHDPLTGRAVLMEINGRFWGSLPLAWHSGAHFAWRTYATGAGLSIGDDPGYRAGVRCCHGVPEAKRLARILFAPERIPDPALRFDRGAELLRWIGTLLDPRTRYYVWSLSDPLPFLADTSLAAVRALGGLFGSGR